MSNLTITAKRIATMSESAIEKVRDLETVLMELPQEPIGTDHVLHGGMYARTVMIPAGVAITGAVIKLATLLIVQGHAQVFTDDGAVELYGYNVIPASAGRKQAFAAITDTWLTMVFPTEATSVDQAEDEFTDEADLLFTRCGIGEQRIVITGE
jgi:hypothetical protein